MLVVTLMSAATLLFMGTLAQASTVTYYGCVNNSTGAITIVSASKTCATGFHKIQWNQQGPVGPKGATGATGATGPQGQMGIQGPPGITAGYVVQCGPNVFWQNVPCPGNNPPLATTVPGTLVLTTPPMAQSGYYFISASTNVVNGVNSSGNSYAECYVTRSNELGAPPYTGFESIGSASLATLSNTDVMFVLAGDTIQLWCDASPAGPSMGLQSNVVWSSLSALLLDQLNPQFAHRSKAKQRLSINTQ